MKKMQKKLRALAQSTHRHDLNQPYSLPLQLIKETAYSFVNPCYKQITKASLQKQLDPYLQYESDGKKIRCITDIGEALHSIFCETPWLKESGWIVEDEYDQTIWFINDNDEERRWFDSVAECMECLYFRYGAFLVQQDDKTHYVIHDKSCDLVVSYPSYELLMHRLYPKIELSCRVILESEKRKDDHNITNAVIRLATDIKHEVCYRYDSKETALAALQKLSLVTSAVYIVDDYINENDFSVTKTWIAEGQFFSRFDALQQHINCSELLQKNIEQQIKKVSPSVENPKNETVAYDKELQCVVWRTEKLENHERIIKLLAMHSGEWQKFVTEKSKIQNNIDLKTQDIYGSEKGTYESSWLNLARFMLQCGQVALPIFVLMAQFQKAGAQTYPCAPKEYSLMGLNADTAVQRFTYQDIGFCYTQVTILNVQTNGQINQGLRIVDMKFSRSVPTAFLKISPPSKTYFLIAGTQAARIRKPGDPPLPRLPPIPIYAGVYNHQGVRLPNGVKILDGKVFENFQFNYTTFGVWPDEYSPNLFVGAGVLMGNFQNVIVDVNSGPLQEPVEAKVGLVPPQLQLVILDRERQFICYHSKAAVFSQLMPPSNRYQSKFQISEPGVLASTNFYMLRTGERKFEYIAFKSQTLGPITVQAFTYSTEQTSPIKDGVAKELLALSPTEQFNVLVFSDQLRTLVYTSSDKVWLQHYTQDYQKFDEPQLLAGLTVTSGSKLYSTTMGDSNRFMVSLADTPSNTYSKVYTRNTLLLKPLGNHTVQPGKIDYSSLLDKIITLVPNEPLTCNFQLQSGIYMAELKLGKDCRISGYTTFAPATLQFNVTVSNLRKTLSALFQLEVKPAAIESMEKTLVFQDESMVVVSLEGREVTASYFTRNKEELLGKTVLKTFSNNTLWLDNLKLQDSSNKEYEVSIIETKNNRRTLVSLPVTRNTLRQVQPFLPFNGSLIQGEPLVIQLAKNFQSTLSSNKIFCSFDLFNRTWPQELKKLPNSCEIQGKVPYSPGLFQFDLVINDTQSTLSGRFNFTVAESNSLAATDLNWLWALSVIGICAIPALCFTSCLVYLCCRGKVLKTFNKDLKAPMLLKTQRQYKDMEETKVSQFASVVDSNKMVTEDQCVVSIMCNRNTPQPDHVYIVLELINEKGEPEIRRMDMLSQQTGSDKSLINEGNHEEESEVVKERCVISERDKNIFLPPLNEDLKTYFYSNVVRGHESDCFHHSWVITTTKAKGLCDRVDLDRDYYSKNIVPYSKFGKNSLITLFFEKALESDAQNCMDWTRDTLNPFLPEGEKIPVKLFDYIATKASHYFEETRGIKYWCS